MREVSKEGQEPKLRLKLSDGVFDTVAVVKKSFAPPELESFCILEIQPEKVVIVVVKGVKIINIRNKPRVFKRTDELPEGEQ